MALISNVFVCGHAHMSILIVKKKPHGLLANFISLVASDTTKPFFLSHKVLFPTSDKKCMYYLYAHELGTSEKSHFVSLILSTVYFLMHLIKGSS